MGPIVGAVKYVVNNDPLYQHRWIDYVDDVRLLRAMKRWSGFVQMRTDYGIMRGLMKRV